MDPYAADYLAALLILGLLALLRLRWLVAFVVGLWVLSALQPPLYALYAAVVADPTAMRAMLGASLGAAFVAALAWRVIHNMVVERIYQEDLESARKKRAARRV